MTSCRDRRQPIGVLVALAVHAIEEHFLQLGGDRAYLAGADGAPVELADRSHFSGGAGEENFVRAL